MACQLLKRCTTPFALFCGTVRPDLCSPTKTWRRTIHARLLLHPSLEGTAPSYAGRRQSATSQESIDARYPYRELLLALLGASRPPHKSGREITHYQGPPLNSASNRLRSRPAPLSANSLSDLQSSPSPDCALEASEMFQPFVLQVATRS